MNAGDAAGDADPLDAIEWPVATARLSVRRWRAGDEAALWRYYRLDEVTEFTSFRTADFESFAEHAAVPERARSRLVVEHDGHVVGDLKLLVVDGWAQADVAAQPLGVQAEVGWAFDPAVHGRGFATEAIEALLALAFGPLGLRRIVAYAFADNRPSIAAMERVGMRCESCTVADGLHRDRGWVDGVVYALLADEWAAAERSRSATMGR